MGVWQKQSSIGVLTKRWSENMQQIYRWKPMPNCDFNKVARNFIEFTIRHGCSPVNLLLIFRPPFCKNTSKGLLLVWQRTYQQISKNRCVSTSIVHLISMSIFKFIAYTLTELCLCLFSKKKHLYSAANKGWSTVKENKFMITVTVGFSKKSFILWLFPRNSFINDLELVFLEF